MLSCLKFMLEAASGTVASAAEASVEEAKSQSFLSGLPGIIMILVFILIFYFLLIRPEKKRKKQEQALRDSLKVGDTVVTIGGITGEVESIRNETITIFTGSNSIDLQKWAVRTAEPYSPSGTGKENTESKDESAD